MVREVDKNKQTISAVVRSMSPGRKISPSVRTKINAIARAVSPSPRRRSSGRKSSPRRVSPRRKSLSRRSPKRRVSGPYKQCIKRDMDKVKSDVSRLPKSSLCSALVRSRSRRRSSRR